VTRKDYELVARVLSRFTNLQAQVEVGAATAAIADAMAASFAIYNPRFNRDKFLAACDVPAKYFESPKEAA
jgi:hypothetical protein